MKLNNKVYDVLKWVCLIGLPAFGVALTGLGQVWNWGIPTEQIVATLGIIEVLLGSLLGISCYNYNKEKKGE